MKSLLLRRAVDVVLIVAALGLVAVVLATSRSITTGEAQARERNVLAAFREEELTRIVIERGAERIVLERQPGDEEAFQVPGHDHEAAAWQIVEPVVEEAGAFQSDAFVTALDHATAVRRISEGEVDRDAMGFAQPRFVVSVAMGEIQYRLVFGADAVAPEGAVYVDVGGEGARRKGVVVVRQETVEKLDVGVDDLREPKLVPYLSDALSALVLEGAGGRRMLRRDGSRWRFDKMLADRRADRRLLSSLFVQLVGLSAEQAVAVPEARRILDGAEDRVAVTELPADGGAPAVIVVGGRCPHDPQQVVALRREPDPQAGCASRDVLRILSTPAEQLLARRLFSVNLDEVELLKVTEAGRRLELVRRESGFLLRQPREVEVEHEAGSRRLLAIVEARGELVADPDLAALGLEPGRCRVLLSTSGADESDVVEEEIIVGEPDADGFVAVQRRADGAVLRVDGEVARALTPDTTLVRSRTLFDFDDREIRRVSISGASEQEVVQDVDGNLSLKRPPGFDLDAALARDLISTLARLEADRWESDHADAGFGLDDPELVVGLEVERDSAESVSHRLVVGGVTTGGNYASLDGDPGVFVLSRPDRSRLAQLVVDRSVFLVDLEQATRLSVRTDRAEVELGRVGGTFEHLAGQPRISVETATRLVDALRELRPEAAIHVGPPRPEEGFDDPVLVVTLEGSPGQREPKRLTFGSGDSWRGISVHYARAEGVDATYVMARSLVRAVVDLL